MKNPFGELLVDLSPSDLRDTAYEVLVAACRSPGSGRPLTYVSGSSFKERSQQLSARPSMDRSTAEGKMAEPLGLRLRKVKGQVEKGGGISGEARADSTRRGGGSVGEFMRVQMRVPEQTDSRIRRGLMRVTSVQLGKRVESMVLPLELLRQFRPSDFSSEKEYDAWQRRYLKVLEAGLLLHPSQPPEESSPTAQRLRKILYTSLEKPNEILNNSESMSLLYSAVNSHACGSAADICHWADGVPLNLHLYMVLLESCFDADDDSSITEEVDEVLEQIKKTWLVLGINQEFHDLCFCWVLFHHYVTTGENKDDLLFASNQMIVEMEKDASSCINDAYLKILSSTLGIISDWSTKRLTQYHDTFYRSSIDSMQLTLSFSISVAKMVHGTTHKQRKKKASIDVACELVEAYIRSSMKNAFIKERENIVSNSNSSKGQRIFLPSLSILAQNICDLAYNEKEIYSPVLKHWHPVATGVAVATLHSCYANELKRFVLATSELTPEAIQVLLAAEKLEKDLVQMAVIDSVDSEDGGKAIIQEMTPYEAESAISILVKSWIQARVDRLGEWVERMLQKRNGILEQIKDILCFLPSKFYV